MRDDFAHPLVHLACLNGFEVVQKKGEWALAVREPAENVEVFFVCSGFVGQLIDATPQRLKESRDVVVCVVEREPCSLHARVLEGAPHLRHRGRLAKTCRCTDKHQLNT